MYELRTERKISQQELAITLGFAKNSICAWEKGRAQPNLETLENIADFFQVSIDYLVGRTYDSGYINIPGMTRLNRFESEVIEKFKQLPEEKKKLVFSLIENLSKN